MSMTEFMRLFYATCACGPDSRPIAENLVSRYYMTMPETEEMFSKTVEFVDNIFGEGKFDVISDVLCDLVSQYECQGFANGFRYCYMIMNSMKLLDCPPSGRLKVYLCGI